MSHDLLRVCEPPVFGAPVWLCTCGYRSWSETAHHHHTKENA